MLSRRPWGTSTLAIAKREGRLPEVVRDALRQTGGSIAPAARLLGVDRSRLYRFCASVDFDVAEAAFRIRATPRAA